MPQRTQRTQRGLAATKELNKRQRRKRRRRRLSLPSFPQFTLRCIANGSGKTASRGRLSSRLEQEETEATERLAALPRCSLFPPFPPVQKTFARREEIEG